VTLRTSTFDLLVPLQPKARPRFSGHAYQDSRYREWMKTARAVLGEWWTVPPLGKGEIVVVSLTFRGPGTSDLDNLIGAILDAGKGIVWTDDRVTVIHRLEASFEKAPRINQSIKLSLLWNR
jgi:hypothetical protein